MQTALVGTKYFSIIVDYREQQNVKSPEAFGALENSKYLNTQRE